MKQLLILSFALLALAGCSSTDQVGSVGAGATGSGADHPASVAILLGLEPVQQDLNLTPAQCGLMDEIRSEYKKQARNITAIGMDGEDAALRSGWDLRNLRKQYNARSLSVLTPSQQDRLRQIERQMLGGSLLTSPAEQQLLGLSTAQQQSITALSNADQANAASINAQFNAGKISSFSKSAALHRNQQKTSSQMLALLDKKQRKNWLILSGQKMGLPHIKDPDASSKSLFEGY